MPTYKLSYFEGRGLAEVSRQILHLSGTPFVDNRISFEKWPKIKPYTPFGQIPILCVNGEEIPQSFAIARYLAKEFGFAGKTPFEAAWVDALGDQHKDYMNEIKLFLAVAHGYAKGDKAQMQRDVAEPAIEKYYTILEKQAKSNGSNGHFVGDSLTWIDLVVSDHIGILETLIPNAVDSFPLVQAVRQKTTSHPKLKEWIDKRPESWSLVKFCTYPELRSRTIESPWRRFAGKTAFEAAWLDALGDQYKDYNTEMSSFWGVAYGFVDGDKEKLQKDVADNGSNGHFVGDSLTWVDLFVSDHIGGLETLIPHAVDAFPLVQEVRKKTTSLPKLKEWLDKRPATAF
ncbi:hypothetical protein PRIPAC_78750 [Pristionchus pacificus]|uniref:glutathione transferase n=1 Tax=Pristionchus pacificus TaxID=54126 RepID=A0A2A6CL82_PRIPA|nr:hypothetical protein PRIPAC_78750 [Pristionchus pacificus]|eukprot:PDM78876.1 Glutathione S-transferase [Pristionchus pacificus]